MERIELEYTGSKVAGKKALAGVVGSGDMEALFEPDKSGKLAVSIKTSVDGSTLRWQRLFDRIAGSGALPAGRLSIHDFGATPGVARLRIEQVFEEASHE
ncbi:malonate decarboxylase acyl carrier protein [Oxalobacter paraformigenes]|uniref:Malonate decarboxylase acyl carrier protein n=1 Tax=Oxalobacter paraformigenes TaxID=556268 RepID=C3X2W6_9BURK|nr:malonate decarboxylase acyl carrier protein [Oxalobacter paraformigenes]EEO27552.1 malonate decarboxylase acyl carrier protein [Oxalobacter paraformigenes]